MYNRSMSATTRERILEIIAQNKAASVAELSRQLHTTVANVRYHLHPLIAEQIVEAIPPANDRPQRGRPAMRFRLSAQSRPTDLARLSADLLALFLDPSQNAPERAAVLVRIAHQRCRAASIQGAPTQRLNLAVEFLNQHAYQARWEARHTGPHIRLANCPFAPILGAYPELCQIDRLMLAELLGARAEIIDSYRPDSGIPAACVFLLQF